MVNELSPSLKEIEDRFLTTFVISGRSAVEKMIEDLEIEAEAARALAVGAQVIQHDTIAVQDNSDTSELGVQLSWLMKLVETALPRWLDILSHYIYSINLIKSKITLFKVNRISKDFQIKNIS